MPCPVRCFKLAEIHDALDWVSVEEPPNALVIELRTDKGVLVLEPHGPLQVEDFERLAAFVDPWIEQHHQLKGIVVQLDGLPGWDDFAAFERHFHFVRNHHKNVGRVAFVGEGLAVTVLPKVAAFFVDAKVKSFEQDKLDDAVAWAASSKRRAKSYDNTGRSSGVGRRELPDEMSQ